MTVLVLGASGATGQHVVTQLLDRGIAVRAIVRSPDRFLDSVGAHESLSVVHASILDVVDESLVSEYLVCPSPTRSAIFNAGKSSRINIAHFMVELVTDDALWRTWRGKTPVIYNVQT